MDRGQETTEVKDSNSSKVAASSSIVHATQQGSSVNASQRLLMARERNDRNRDHLSTAFRVYKQLYGEEAAKEAFIEIAANIAQDEKVELARSSVTNVAGCRLSRRFVAIAAIPGVSSASISDCSRKAFRHYSNTQRSDESSGNARLHWPA